MSHRFLATPRFLAACDRLTARERAELQRKLLQALLDPSRWREIRGQDPGREYAVYFEVGGRFAWVFFKHPFRDTLSLRDFYRR